MTRYVISEEEEDRIQQEFVEQFGTNYWYYRLFTLDYAIENSEDIFEHFEEVHPSFNMEDYRHTMKSEVLFIFYHVSEALFSLLQVMDARFPRLALKNINGYAGAREVLEEFTKDDARNAFYPFADPENETVRKSAENISTYLPVAADQYHNPDHVLYNEYKHGLRTIAGGEYIRLEFLQDGLEAEDSVQIDRGGETHVYYKTSKPDLDVEGLDDESLHLIERVIEGYDWEYYHQLALTNTRLLEQLISVFRARDSDSEMVRSLDLSDMDFERIFSFDEDKVFRVQFPVSHGNRVVPDVK